MTRMQAGEMISEEDARALEELAEAWLEHHGGMPLEALDGFFSALVVGPGATVMPSEYLSLAVGEGKQWESMEEQEHALGLLVRLWNHIVWRVGQPIPEEEDASDEAMETGFALMPFIALPEPENGTGVLDPDDPFAGVPEDYPVGALWASGFMQGVMLRAGDWDRLLQDDEDLTLDMGDLIRMSMVSPEQAGEAGVDWDSRPDFSERWELLTSLPGLLQAINEDRIEALSRQEPIRRDPQPGRNDLCTCGSGRKFKKCCGGQTLH